MKRRTFLSAAIFALFSSSVLLAAAGGAEKIRVACVGDSITFGAGVRDRANNSYPVVLGKSLGEDYDVRNFGVSGATLLKAGNLPYWKTGAFKATAEFQPNVIVIKLGTNDSKPGNWKNKDQFAADLAAMVDHFATLPSKPKIWLCKPVPVYRTAWGINDRVVKGEVIPLIEKVAKEKNLPVIDLYAALSDAKELFPDGVHPNVEGARRIAVSVKAAIASP